MNWVFKKPFLVFAILLLGSYRAVGQSDEYRYAVDLADPQNDALLVTLKTPAINQKSILFYMPKIVPGTYRASDYGLFVSDLKAYDKKGKMLPVQKVDTNSWKIERADKMVRLTYKVDDIFDTKKPNRVFMMAATNIEAGKDFVIQTPGFFGYFEDMKEQPFTVNITHPDSLYGSTGLIPFSVTPKMDVYKTGDYDELVDSPMMYNVPDTTFIEVGNARVLISVYSPHNLITSAFLAKKFETMLKATAQYLGGELPVKKYAFILYFADPKEAKPSQGALEHSYSSFYYISEIPQEKIASLMVDISAHEFLHIVTPLSIHSKEIEDFNFNVPDLSEHLWLYEGVTEYSSDHVQVKYDIITPEEFLQKLAKKINISKTAYLDTLPFTELSKKAAGEYSGQYGNVYEKGALIAAMLDIKLIQYSQGKIDLQGLLRILSQKYGKRKPFVDEDLFGAIEKLTYPEIGEFLRRYVGGNESIPYQEIFEKVGVKYNASEDSEVASLGHVSIKVNSAKEMEIISVEGLNEFGKAMGYMPKDAIVSLQGEMVTPENSGQIIDDFIHNTQDGDTVFMVVKRRSASGEYKKVTLEAPAMIIEKKGQVTLNFIDNPTEEQLMLRKKWLHIGV